MMAQALTPSHRWRCGEQKSPCFSGENKPTTPTTHLSAPEFGSGFCAHLVAFMSAHRSVYRSIRFDLIIHRYALRIRKYTQNGAEPLELGIPTGTSHTLRNSRRNVTELNMSNMSKLNVGQRFLGFIIFYNLLTSGLSVSD